MDPGLETGSPVATLRNFSSFSQHSFSSPLRTTPTLGDGLHGPCDPTMQKLTPTEGIRQSASKIQNTQSKLTAENWTVLFLHGLESGPQGKKAQYLIRQYESNADYSSMQTVTSSSSSSQSSSSSHGANQSVNFRINQVLIPDLEMSLLNWSKKNCPLNFYGDLMKSVEGCCRNVVECVERSTNLLSESNPKSKLLLVGSSWGGLIALKLLEHSLLRPDRVLLLAPAIEPHMNSFMRSLFWGDEMNIEHIPPPRPRELVGSVMSLTPDQEAVNDNVAKFPTSERFESCKDEDDDKSTGSAETVFPDDEGVVQLGYDEHGKKKLGRDLGSETGAATGAPPASQSQEDLDQTILPAGYKKQKSPAVHNPAVKNYTTPNHAAPNYTKQLLQTAHGLLTPCTITDKNSTTVISSSSSSSSLQNAASNAAASASNARNRDSQRNNSSYITILHGTADTVVDINGSRRFVSKFPGISFLYEIPNGNHGLTEALGMELQHGEWGPTFWREFKDVVKDVVAGYYDDCR